MQITEVVWTFKFFFHTDYARITTSIESLRVNRTLGYPVIVAHSAHEL